MGFHESQCVGLYFISAEYALLLHINMTKIRKGSVVVCVLAALCHFFYCVDITSNGPSHCGSILLFTSSCLYFAALHFFYDLCMWNSST